MERIFREMWMRAKARSFEYRARGRERRKEKKRTEHNPSLASPWKLSWSCFVFFFSSFSLHPSTHSLVRSSALALVMRFSLFRIPALAFSLFLLSYFFPLLSTEFPFVQASVQACLSLSYEIPTASCFTLGCGMWENVKFLALVVRSLTER